MSKRFWSFRAQENGVAELLLYGVIDEDESWGGVGAKEFAEELKKLGAIQEIRVRINSSGGYVFAGQAIYSTLKRHPATVTVYVDGLAASIASVIAMAGDRVIMPKNALMMVHNPWGLAIGDAEDLRKEAEVLDTITETIISAYQDKTGLERNDIIELMEAETWMTARDALDWGFIDEIEGEGQIAASVRGWELVVKSETGEARLSLESLKQTEEMKKKVAALPAAQAERPESGETIEPEGGKEMNLEELAEQYPELLEEIRNQARTEGAKQERERIRAIEDLAVKGFDEIVTKAKFEEPKQPEDVAVAIIKAQKERGEKVLESLRQDAKALEGVAPGATELDAGKGEEDEVTAQASKIALAFKRR
jgi:ATP-dependent Clp endopeptidase proteolytic subunit ClpP